MKRLFVFPLLLLVVLFAPQQIEAKRDSLSMARKAERKRQKEERRQQEELEELAQPHFKGGNIDKFERWVLENLHYDYGMFPPNAPHVTLDVPFFVEADGSTSLTYENYASKNVHPRLAQEVERVILFSPEWDPAHGPLGNPIQSRQVLTLTLKNRMHTDPSLANSPSHVPPRPKPIPRPRRPVRR